MTNKPGTHTQGFLNYGAALASILAGAMISISGCKTGAGVWLRFYCAVLLLLLIRAAHLQGIANQL